MPKKPYLTYPLKNPLVIFLLSFSFIFFLSTSVNISARAAQEIVDHRYTGQTLDGDSNLYYYHARYYDPVLGIFTSPDKAQGSNRYAYVGGNPIMRNDPSGMVMATDDNGGPPGETWGGNLRDPQRWQDFGSAVMDVGVWTAAGGLSAGGPGAMFGTIAGAYQGSSRLSDRYPRLQYIQQTTGNIAYGVASFVLLCKGAQLVRSGLADLSILRGEQARTRFVQPRVDELRLAGVNVRIDPNLGSEAYIHTLGSNGKEILPGTIDPTKIEIVLPPNFSLPMIDHETKHLLDGIDRLYQGAPDMTLGTPLSIARIRYEIEAGKFAAASGMAYGTTPDDFLSTVANGYLVGGEATGQGWLFRLLTSGSR